MFLAIRKIEGTGGASDDPYSTATGESESTWLAKGSIVHVICYGGMAGTFGGQSVLFAKSTVELVKSSWTGGNAFQHFQPYIIVVGMALSLILQITILNEGLRRFDALVMVPVYQAFWILMTTAGGIMYFEEYTSMTKWQKVCFAFGTVTTIYGICILLEGNASRMKVSKGDIQYEELTQMTDWGDDDEDEGEDDMSAFNAQSSSGGSVRLRRGTSTSVTSGEGGSAEKRPKGKEEEGGLGVATGSDGQGRPENPNAV